MLKNLAFDLCKLLRKQHVIDIVKVSGVFTVKAEPSLQVLLELLFLNTDTPLVNLFQPSVAFDTETSHSFCRAKQMIGF